MTLVKLMKEALFNNSLNISKDLMKNGISGQLEDRRKTGFDTVELKKRQV